MLFPTTLSATFLGLAVLATAAPHPHPHPRLDINARDTSDLAARGLVYVPRNIITRRNNNNNNNDFITITQTEEEQLTEIQYGQEVQFTELVVQQIQVLNQKKIAQDNVRKNHYRNKNSNVNTIITVITEVINIQDSSNQNSRYLSRQIKADNEASENVFIVVTEVQQLTVGGTPTASAGFVASTGYAVSSDNSFPADASGAFDASLIPTYDASTASVANNSSDITLVPQSVGAPSLSGFQSESDPAIIIEEEEAVFVEFSQQSEQSEQSEQLEQIGSF